MLSQGSGPQAAERLPRGRDLPPIRQPGGIHSQVRRCTMCPRRIVAAAIILCFATASAALATPPSSNILSGVIPSDLTLTVASPGPVYYVVGDLTVPEGRTLTVEPGVTLLMGAGLSIGGSLIARGTPADSIYFLGTGGPRLIYGSYGGDVDFEYTRLTSTDVSSSLGELVLSHCALSDGWITSDNGTVTLSYCYLPGSGIGTQYSTLRMLYCDMPRSYGVHYYFGAASIGGCDIGGTGGEVGIDLYKATLEGATDDERHQPTIVHGFATGVVGSPWGLIENVVTYDNDIGIAGNCSVSLCTVARNRSGGIDARGGVGQSIVTHNGGYGVRLLDPYSCAIGCSDLWMNSVDLDSDCQPVPALISEDPMYLDFANNDFRLAETSPFKYFGPCGGWEIGAYGPGSGLPIGTNPTTWGRIKAHYR